MWNWLNCYLSGRHDYGVWCERGVIFLRCVHCGGRSSGWSLEEKTPRSIAAATPRLASTAGRLAPSAPAPIARVIPFGRAAS